MGDYAAARPLFEQALDLRQRVLGPDHPDVANSMNNLSALYEAMGRHLEALDRMRQAAAIDQHMIGQIFSMASERQRMAYLNTLG